MLEDIPGTGDWYWWISESRIFITAFTKIYHYILNKMIYIYKPIYYTWVLI